MILVWRYGKEERLFYRCTKNELLVVNESTSARQIPITFTINALLRHKLNTRPVLIISSAVFFYIELYIDK
jgi:hypothetical protein